MSVPEGVEEIAPGLWRWTAAHPGWRPGAAAGSAGDWDRDVGSVACRLADATVFIDALLPEDRPDLWEWAAARAAERDRVLALTTIKFHRRSRDRLVERFEAQTSRARTALPEGIEKVTLAGAGEVAYWIPEHQALVPGDRILGARGGGLRLCPPSWLCYLGTGLTHEHLREILRPLLALPVERVLVSHGEPVLSGGDAALAKLIG
jgi:hypothetical protein